jgi:predicted Zn-dependent peptidase
MQRAAAVLVAIAVLGAAAAAAQDLAAFEKRTASGRLENGLQYVVCERPEAPVVSFFTRVDAGSAQEVPGITGLAHMFEHMAFKGTETIGTTNWPAEKTALEKVESAYSAWDRARRQPIGRDEAKVRELEKEFRAAVEEAERYVVKNAYGEIVEREGGEGLNASTSSDETDYEYSFPSNRVELWAYLESERFLHPVFREFYAERDVVMEERRMRTDSQPTGRLLEQFLATAFSAHPYRHPVVGWPSDLEAFSATDAKKFFDTYYVPASIVVAVVGDVRAADVVPILRKYFGRLPARPRPEPLRTVEPPQASEKEVVIVDPSQPFYLEGYHKPGARDRDDAVYDAISDLLSEGRTSRLYRSLVRDKRIAASAAGFSGLPGDKYPNLFAFYAVALPGHSNSEIAAAIREEIEKLRREDVTDAELAMVKRRARASLLRKMNENEGLAAELAAAQALFGDWRELFRQVDRIERVTKADIRRVAAATFTAGNRTIGRIETEAPAAAPAVEPEKKR